MADGRIVEQRAAVVLEDPEASYYPDSDGQPMAENDEHRWAIQSLLNPLELRYRKRADAYVSGDLLLYYRQGDASRCVAPDVLVVHGVAPGPRRTYLLWQEGKPPDFVAEVSSPRSRIQDRTTKRELYARLGVQEYFLFDPAYEDRGQAGRLQGYRLWGSGSVEVGPGGERGSEEELRSEVLGLSLRPEGKRIRLRDLATGADLRYSDETEEVLQRTEEALRTEQEERRRAEEARRTAEARVAELEALLGAASHRDGRKTRND